MPAIDKPHRGRILALVVITTFSIRVSFGLLRSRCHASAARVAGKMSCDILRFCDAFIRFYR